MKKQKHAKSELERRLEEEMRREAQSGGASRASHTTAEGPEKNLDEGEDLNDKDESFVDAAFAKDDEKAETTSETLDRDFSIIENELNETKDKLLRTHAEFDNYRKRTARDTERFRKMAAENIIRDLLPVVDHLELALQHANDQSGGLSEGVDMVLKQLSQVLERNGLKPIPAVGENFDPRVHEAVAHIDSETVAQDQIAQEFQRGYILGDQVIRPSKVAVSKGTTETTSQEG